MGMALTGVSNLLFAVINPHAVYWAFGFPAAILSVFGADFVFAAGTLFVAKVCLPHEQSVGGALFQTMTQVSRCHADPSAAGLTTGIAWFLVWTCDYDDRVRLGAREGVEEGGRHCERGWDECATVCAAIGI